MTATPLTHSQETDAGRRFGFGANWSRFLDILDDARIAQAQDSLCRMLGVDSLLGLRMLDAGSGSGLFSLAARRLGAQVHSFDFDPQSVACTRELRRRYFTDDPTWQIEEGSVLDPQYLRGLGSFDIVYSWGVLHHTGSMWAGLDLVVERVRPGGKVFVAIYNDQGWISRYWSAVKRAYVGSRAARWPLLLLHAPYLYGGRWLARRLSGRARVARGMALWVDMVDWVGGYPFEVARPEEVIRFARARGLRLHELVTCGGRHGCNEFVFDRPRLPDDPGNAAPGAAA